MSYSLGFNRYRDRTTGESFDGDFDQRHTFNAYGLFRLTNRFSLAAKLRMGSNVPATGYWEQRGDAFFVGSVRNALRVPAYSRLDLRANRTFNWQTKRLTLFVEVMNVLGRENVRFEHARRRHPHGTGVRDVQLDDPARAVGGGADRVLSIGRTVLL